MEKTFALLLALLLCLALCACGSDDIANDDVTANDNAPAQIQESDIPSKDLIQTDLEKALLAKNEYAAMTDFETVKSLTGEGSYEITLSVKAETKYADWTYEVDMDYRKYDQGWMVDDVSWGSGHYEQVRIPDADTMQTYAKEYLLSREDYYEDYFLSVENGAVNLESDSSTGSNMLVYTWDAIEEESFYDIMYEVATWWEYNPGIDNWEVIPDNTAGSLGYCVFASGSTVPKKNLDLTGTWYARDNQGNIMQGKYYTEFVFSNFSWDEFDLRIPGTIDTSEHFTIASYNPFGVDTYDLIFTNETGEYIAFYIQDYVGIMIYYFNDGLTLERGVFVEEELMHFT